MNGVMKYLVRKNGQTQSLRGFRHNHGSDLKIGHIHLMGGPAEYIDWSRTLLSVKGDHYHRVEDTDVNRSSAEPREG